MAKNFEDMHWQEWPEDLIELHEAAQLAWKAYAALEDILDVRVKTTQRVMDTTRSNLVELTGRAYALLRDLRAEGMRQLAAWEESQEERQMEQQLVKLAENEEESQAQPQDQYFICGRCKGDPVAHGVFVARDGVIIAGDFTPPCPYCGRSDCVQLVEREKENVNSPQN